MKSQEDCVQSLVNVHTHEVQRVSKPSLESSLKGSSFFALSLSLCLSPIKEGFISVMPSSLISVQRVSSRDPAQSHHQSHPVNGQGEHRGLSCSFCPQGDRHPLNIRTRAHTHKQELELANFLLTVLRIATRMASPWHDDLSSARLWFRIKPLQFSKQKGFVRLFSLLVFHRLDLTPCILKERKPCPRRAIHREGSEAADTERKLSSEAHFNIPKNQESPLRKTALLTHRPLRSVFKSKEIKCKSLFLLFWKSSH